MTTLHYPTRKNPPAMPYGTCDYEISPASRYIDPEPAEYCWADTAEGADLCPEHGGPGLDEEVTEWDA